MVYRIPKEPIFFPDPHEGESDGLFCVGGDLSAERLILAYHNGIFPWFDFHRPEPYWYCPMQRFVIFPNEIHVSHSMRTLLNKMPYRVTLGEDFEGVMRGCGTAQGRNEHIGAWLGEDIIKAYTELHRLNYATSVGVWDSDRLVGGLYGVTVRKCFIGESMFSLVPNASKVALIFLATTLMLNKWKFIDCQLETPHLKSMGARFIPYEEYMEILNS